MGLVIESLLEVKPDVERSYWIYLLNYGLDEELAKAIRSNLFQIAERTSRAKSVFVMGTSMHFTDEVLSWHQIFGLSGEEYLPSILISTRNPHEFREGRVSPSFDNQDYVIIPLRGLAATGSDAVALFNSLLVDIEGSRPLSDFSIRKKMVSMQIGPEWGKAIVLKPSFMGMGIDLQEFGKSLRRYLESRQK